MTDEQLWAAKKIKDAIIHPDTGEVIPMPFRMSGFVPFGTPVVVGLLLPNQTLVTTLFWQWLNQTHNALVNYSNRNASVPVPASSYIGGYLGAVASAMVSFHFVCFFFLLVSFLGLWVEIKIFSFFC